MYNKTNTIKTKKILHSIEFIQHNGNFSNHNLLCF